MSLPTPETLIKDYNAADEHAHQVALFMWAAIEATRAEKRLAVMEENGSYSLEDCYLQGKWLHLRKLFAIPSGGERNVVVASRLKAEGVRKGVPDTCLPYARGPYHGCWIEMKRMDAVGKRQGGASDEQVERIEQLKVDGYWAGVCHGWMHARDTLNWYLDLGEYYWDATTALVE